MSFNLRVTGLLLLAVLFLISTPTPLVSSATPPPPPPLVPMLISPVDGAVMDNGCTPKPNGITWDFVGHPMHEAHEAANGDSFAAPPPPGANASRALRWSVHALSAYGVA